MATMAIKDLTENMDLDRQAMASIIIYSPKLKI
jgi:hypothetical protein